MLHTYIDKPEVVFASLVIFRFRARGKFSVGQRKF